MASLTSEQSRNGRAVVFQVVLLLVIAIYLAGIPMGIVRSENRLGVPEILLLAILFLSASGLITRLVDLSISPTGVSARFQEIETRQKTIESQVRALQLVMKGLVTEFEYEKLRGIAASGPFMVRYHNDMYEELKRLDAIRYIQPQPGYGIVSIRDRDGRGDEFDLKQYIRLTNEGLEYLKLREELFQAAR